MQYTSFVVVPIAQHAFFEKAQFKRLFCDNLLEIHCFAAQFLHLVRVRSTRCIACQTLLSLSRFIRTDGIHLNSP